MLSEQPSGFLSYLPDNNRELAPVAETSLELEGYVEEEAILLRKTFADSPSGFNTPLDMRLFLQQLVDYGDYFELQPERAKQLITAFGRMGGSVVGFLVEQQCFQLRQHRC